MKELRSRDQYEDKLTRLVFPVIGDKPIADIRRSHYNALLDHIEKRSGPIAADRTLSVVWGVLKFHARRDDDYIIPLIPGMNRANPRERARSRILKDDEIRKLWATDDLFVRFLLLTSARRSEVSGMQWKELTDDVRGNATKTRSILWGRFLKPQ